MHDIKLIRKSPEIFDESLKKRGENSKSLEIIAQRWGINIGVKYAEAFRLVRHIEKLK